MNICEDIRNARKGKGFSQQDMADKLDKARSTYAEWEKNTEPPASEFIRIAEILEIDVLQYFSKKPETNADSIQISRNAKIELEDFLKIKSYTFTYLHAIAKMMSKLNGLPLEDCVIELENETKLNLREILGLQ